MCIRDSPTCPPYFLSTRACGMAPSNPFQSSPSGFFWVLFPRFFFGVAACFLHFGELRVRKRAPKYRAGAGFFVRPIRQAYPAPPICLVRPVRPARPTSAFPLFSKCWVRMRAPTCRAWAGFFVRPIRQAHPGHPICQIRPVRPASADPDSTYQCSIPNMTTRSHRVILDHTHYS